jgi:ribosomal protein S6
MTESNMPAAEAVVETGADLQSYELAFHVLPTVAEGEVSVVFDRMKAAIQAVGGQITNEEVPARFDLAYEIVKFLEGRNRKFGSAYFGWVRFTVEADKVSEITAAVEGTKEILRHLVIRLTKVEEAHPFLFHPSVADRKVETIVIEEEIVDALSEDVETEEAEKVMEGGEDIEETV